MQFAEKPNLTTNLHQKQQQKTNIFTMVAILYGSEKINERKNLQQHDSGICDERTNQKQIGIVGRATLESITSENDKLFAIFADPFSLPFPFYSMLSYYHHIFYENLPNRIIYIVMAELHTFRW